MDISWIYFRLRFICMMYQMYISVLIESKFTLLEMHMYTTSKSLEYLGSSTETLVFDIFICWKWLCTKHQTHHANLRSVTRKQHERWNKIMTELCGPRYSILSFCIVTKSCFICMNHVYLNFKTRLPLISVKWTWSGEWQLHESNNTCLWFVPSHF